MFRELTSTRAATCVSDLAMDAYLAEELDRKVRDSVSAHLEVCTRCRARLHELETEAAAYFASTPATQLQAELARRGRSARRRLRWGYSAVAALAAAIGLALLPQGGPEQTATRSKGESRLGFYVKHGAHVRRGADHERVQPGDQLRFTYASPRAAHLTILSFDAAGRAGVYFPTAAIAPGQNVALPSAVELDETLGLERLFGLLCREPLSLEPLLRELERRAGALSAPSGCELHVLHIAKEARE